MKVYPLPRIEQLLLLGGTVFSILDLSDAYNQLQLDDVAQESTTINTHKDYVSSREFPLV